MTSQKGQTMIKVDETFDINYVDSSGLSEFNRCPAKYLFSRQLGLHKRDSASIYLDYGTDMHIALPHCYTGTIEGMRHAYSLFKDSWTKRSYGESDDKRNLKTAMASIEDFCNNHTPQNCLYEVLQLDIPVVDCDRVSKNEVPFLIDTGGDLPLAGRIDTIVRWKADNSIRCLDYKTASEISQRYFACFDNCPQALGYTLAACHIVPGHVCDGMLIEAVRISKKNVENQISMNFVSHGQLESFIRFVNRTSKDIIDCNEGRRWPKKCSNCAPYAAFGMAGRQCEYLDICRCPSWEDAAKFYDKTEPFHPLKVRK